MLDVTPLILTFNEAPNIERTVQKLTWARDILVLDSFSTDETLSILRRFPQVRVIQRAFDSFAGQCNFGLTQIDTEWVLSLDADYVLSDALVAEIAALDPAPDVLGYRAAFRYCVYGRPLRSSLYPPRTVLYRRAHVQYRDEGHGHRACLSGRVQSLAHPIDHDDRKSLDRWFGEQMRYAALEATNLRTSSPRQLNRADRLRQWIIPAPVLVLFYTLFAKRTVLDGWPGWFYAFQRTTAEILLSLRLLEARLKSES